MDAQTRPQRPVALTWRWLEQLPGGLLGTWRERRVARRTSEETMRVYRHLEATQPYLTGIALYQELVARRTGLDGEAARTVVERAEDSFASWPVERPVTLRDVVQYLVVHECLNADPAALGTRSRLTTIIAEVIPENL